MQSFLGPNVGVLPASRLCSRHSTSSSKAAGVPTAAGGRGRVAATKEDRHLDSLTGQHKKFTELAIQPSYKAITLKLYL